MAMEIRTVVILMLENQSFDRAMGWHPTADVPKDRATLMVDLSAYPWMGMQNHILTWGPGAVRRQLITSPHYPAKHMHRGFSPGGADDPALSDPNCLSACQPEVLADVICRRDGAFLKKVLPEDQDTEANRKTLALAALRQSFLHLRKEDVPMFGFLADHFTICDHWFSTHLSHTHPNRAGFLQDCENHDAADAVLNPGWNLFDACEEHGTTVDIVVDHWASSLTLTLPAWALRAKRWRRARGGFTPPPPGEFQLAELLQKHAADQQKHLVWVEPNHMGFADARSNDLKDAHLWNGQELIHEVYEAVRTADPSGEHTLLIVCYDEHGGWYDHVKPPLAPWARRPYRWNDLYGGRTPAFLVSGWVKNGYVLRDELSPPAITAQLRTWGFFRGYRAGSLSQHLASDPLADAWSSEARPLPPSTNPWHRHTVEERNQEYNLTRTLKGYHNDLTQEPKYDESDLDNDSFHGSLARHYSTRTPFTE